MWRHAMASEMQLLISPTSCCIGSGGVCVLRVGIGSGGFVLFVAAQDVPVDIRSQVLASDGAICDLLNLNTALYRNPANTVDPL